MKRIVLVGVMLLVGGVLVSAIGLSVSPRGGLGLGMDRESDGVDMERDSAGQYSTYNNLFYSLGGGKGGLVSVDVAFTDYLSVELGGGLRFGAIFQDMQTVLDGTPPGTTEYAHIENLYFPLFLTAKGRIPLGRSTLYIGAGPSSCFLNSTTTDFQEMAGVEEYLEMETTYTMGWGYHGVVGVEFPLGKRDRLSLCVEARGEQLTVRPKKSVLTVYTVDGVDQLMVAYPDVADREIEYVRDLSDYMNDPYDPNSPSQEFAYNLSADNVSVYVGIVWRIF